MEHTEAHRAVAAETLAYLTEVDSNLQQIAAISNQLVSALVDLLGCSSVSARTAAFRYGKPSNTGCQQKWDHTKSPILQWVFVGFSLTFFFAYCKILTVTTFDCFDLRR